MRNQSKNECIFILFLNLYEPIGAIPEFRIYILLERTRQKLDIEVNIGKCRGHVKEDVHGAHFLGGAGLLEVVSISNVLLLPPPPDQD